MTNNHKLHTIGVRDMFFNIPKKPVDKNWNENKTKATSLKTCNLMYYCITVFTLLHKKDFWITFRPFIFYELLKNINKYF